MKGLVWQEEPHYRLYLRDTPEWLLLGEDAQAVYMGLLRHLDRQGRYYYGQLKPDEAVAIILRWDPTRVSRGMARLLEMGFLVDDPEGRVVADPDFAARESAPRSDRLRAKEYRKRAATVTNRDGDITIRDATVTRNHTASRSVTKRDGVSWKKKALAEDQEFLRWYTCYPRKVARQDALRAWHQVEKRRPSLEVMLAKLMQQKRSDQWTREGGQYVPYPATYLRQHRWEDQEMRIGDGDSPWLPIEFE